MNLVQTVSDDQTNSLFKSRYLNECHRVNKFMMWLMLSQWLAGVCFAVFYSPLTWIGQSYEIHVHVWVAILLGGAISSFAILWTRLHPDSVHSRHVIAIAQMLWSALLIHLSGGRIETHFHVFASLAILSIYRDWKILITATIVVAVDHFIRGVFYPLSAFGIIVESPFRWIEHAAWVIFEVSFLAPGCVMLRNEIRELCVRQTELAEAKATVDRRVEDRTRELASRGQVIEESLNEIFIFDAQTLKFVYANRAGRSNLGYESFELLQLTPLDIKPKFSSDTFRQLIRPLDMGDQSQLLFQTTHLRKDGSSYVAEIRLQKSNFQDRDAYLAMILDVTERVASESRNAQLQNELLDASRTAGMAEVATGVLHNVGNILNSVNISASMIRKQLQQSAFSNLERISALISEHESDFVDFVKDDRRGQMIPVYIARLTETLRSERQKTNGEFHDLISHVDHIKQIVSAQQSMATSLGMRQELSPAELVTNSITVSKGTLTNHNIGISTEIQEQLPTLVSDKHKILQILINLIKNAKDAIIENETVDPQIKIVVRSCDKDVEFVVMDNGIGIAEDRIHRIFQHGFTTKNTGHGFGLHSSANAATELGGLLTVSSPGSGQGAAFKLRIPATLEPIDREPEEVFSG